MVSEQIQQIVSKEIAKRAKTFETRIEKAIQKVNDAYDSDSVTVNLTETQKDGSKVTRKIEVSDKSVYCDIDSDSVLNLFGASAELFVKSKINNRIANNIRQFHKTE
jgi:hypothetical protein